MIDVKAFLVFQDGHLVLLLVSASYTIYNGKKSDIYSFTTIFD